MRFILTGLAAIVALCLAIVLIGLLLPATREGRAEITINATPAAILATIRAVEDQPEWRDGIAGVARTGDGWVETTARGEDITFTPEEMTEITIRLRFTASSGFGGTWTAQMTAEGTATRIAVVEQVTVPSPIGRILSRLFFNPDGFATTYLGALKQRVEGK